MSTDRETTSELVRAGGMTTVLRNSGSTERPMASGRPKGPCRFPEARGMLRRP